MVEPEEQLEESSLVSHLIELRDRLLRMLICVTVVVIALFPFRKKIYSFLAEPLTQHMPDGASMIAIEVASTFLAPFKMVVMLAVVLSVPYLLHQVWSFVAPGLYQREKKFAAPLLCSSVLLFYIGMTFAYYVVFPLVFGFFAKEAPAGVAVMTDISRYLDFVIKLFFAFGLSFEVPIATYLVVSAGLVKIETLKNSRPYIIVGAFVVGMLLTPPDIISQVLLAVPIWLLFEVGLLFAQSTTKKDSDSESAASELNDS